MKQERKKGRELPPEEKDLRDFWVAWVRRRFPQMTWYGRGAVPQWDGFYDMRKGRNNHESVWRKILALQRTEGVQPKRLMRMVLDGWLQVQPPAPTYLISAPALAAYRSLPPDDCEKLETRLAADATAVQIRLSQAARNPGYSSDAARVEAVLYDADLNLLPVFRYTALLAAGLPAGGPLLAAAQLEYDEWRVEYDKVWGPRVPPELRKLQQAEVLNGC